MGFFVVVVHHHYTFIDIQVLKIICLMAAPRISICLQAKCDLSEMEALGGAGHPQ